MGVREERREREGGGGDMKRETRNESCKTDKLHVTYLQKVLCPQVSSNFNSSVYQLQQMRNWIVCTDCD